jgi:ADP-ribose pyrophosphatase YjhB (NUDIX family)
MSNLSERTRVFVSGALFSAEGKLLVLRRAETQGWELPGGALEFGEAPEIGLVRCFREATDMDIAVDRPLSAWSVVESADGGPQHSVHVAFVVRLSGALGGVECDRAVHSGFAWLARAEALERVGFSAQRVVVEKAFATLAQTRRSG